MATIVLCGMSLPAAAQQKAPSQGYPGQPGFRPSTGGIADRFNRDKAKQQQQVIDAIKKQQAQVAESIEKANAKLPELTENVQKAQEKHRGLKEVAEKDEQAVLDAKREWREAENRAIEAQPQDSPVRVLEQAVEKSIAEEERSLASILDLPVTNAKSKQELTNILIKLTPAQKNKLAADKEHQRAKEQTKVASERATAARNELFAKDQTVVAAKAEVQAAEIKAKKSKADETLAVRGVNQSQQQLAALQQAIATAQKTHADLSARLK